MAEIIPTTVVGSYPQPEWLIDRDDLRSQLPPRVRVRELWRIPELFLEQAQDDATVVAIRAMERAGSDIVSDGEIRRESYSNRFATWSSCVATRTTVSRSPCPARSPLGSRRKTTATPMIARWKVCKARPRCIAEGERQARMRAQLDHLDVAVPSGRSDRCASRPMRAARPSRRIPGA